MFEKKNISKKLKEIEKNLENQDSWQDFEKTNKELKLKNYLSNFLESINKFGNDFDDTLELIKLSSDNDGEEFEKDLEKDLNKIETGLNLLYLETLMSGKADSKNALLEIHAGAGGVESQDWAEMLLRMYTRWAESKNFKVELIVKISLNLLLLNFTPQIYLLFSITLYLNLYFP